jgi:C4-dicarboxylate-specific signal transduction histidine kinase
MSDEHRDRAERPRSIGELRFFGAITASISHEINNVLAMVNELSGLFEDSLMMARKGRPLDPERLSGIAERISGQVERGKQIVTGLNSFAHCVDNPRSSLDLAENLEQITALCQRFARLRRAELTVRAPETPVHLQGCAFVLDGPPDPSTPQQE